MLNFMRDNVYTHCVKWLHENDLQVTRLDEFVNFATMAEGSDEAPSGRRSKSLFRRLYERPACPHPAPLERDAFWRSQAWLSRLVLETQLCAPLTPTLRRLLLMQSEAHAVVCASTSTCSLCPQRGAHWLRKYAQLERERLAAHLRQR